MKLKFNNGDKVKLPTTKGIGESIRKSCVMQNAKEEGQDYLYVTGFNEIIGAYIVDSTIEDSVYCDNGDYYANGDHFLESDLAPYEEEPKMDEIKRGSIITCYRPEYKTIHQYMLVQDGDSLLYKLISMVDGVGFKILTNFGSRKPEYVTEYLKDYLGMEIMSIENPKPIKLSAKISVEIVREEV